MQQPNLTTSPPHEQEHPHLSDAFLAAAHRSRQSNKVVYVDERDSGGYVVYTHGIAMQGRTPVAKFHKGQRLG